MPSAEFNTLATARELRAAGIEAAHAEAIVNAASRATDGLLTESRFEAAMAEQTAYLDKRLAEQTAYLEKSLAEQRASLETGLAEQKSEIYRYLWLHGSMIILVLGSLYAVVESWLRT